MGRLGRPLPRARPRVAAVVLAAALGTPCAARAQAPGAEQPIVIDYADELRRVVEGDSLTYHLQGNVRAHRGDLHMRSQRAIVYRGSGVADFTRDVHFWDPSTEIYADHVVYTEPTDVAVATGQVQVVDRQTGSNVSADTVRYDRAVGLVTAWPRPHAILVPRDTTQQDDPFNVWADRMRFRSDSISSEFVGVRDVLIERTDLTAIGDSLHYDEEGRLALRVRPQVETAETFLVAQRIDVVLVDDEIESLIALGDARAVQKTDSVPPAVAVAFDKVSDTSYLEGDSVHVSFAGEGIESVVAHGNARSLNYARESPRGPVETWSVNYLLGDKLTLRFRADTLRQVLATGGHRGLYRQQEVRVGGPERRESEPIPLPPLWTVAGGMVVQRGPRGRDGEPR